MAEAPASRPRMPDLIRAMWLCVGVVGLVPAIILIPHAHADFEIPALYISVLLLVVLLPIALLSTLAWKIRLRLHKPLPPFKPNLPGKRDGGPRTPVP